MVLRQRVWWRGPNVFLLRRLARDVGDFRTHNLWATAQADAQHALECISTDQSWKGEHQRWCALEQSDRGIRLHLAARPREPDRSEALQFRDLVSPIHRRRR